MKAISRLAEICDRCLNPYMYSYLITSSKAMSISYYHLIFLMNLIG